jgi:hypothetical protein
LTITFSGVLSLPALPSELPDAEMLALDTAAPTLRPIAWYVKIVPSETFATVQTSHLT